jgi:hypothetical protein
LRYAEVALIEVLRAWPETVEASWADLVRVAKRLAADDEIRIDQILNAAEGERSPRFRKLFADLLNELDTQHRRQSTVV